MRISVVLPIFNMFFFSTIISTIMGTGISIGTEYCKDATNTGYRIRPGPSKMKSRFNPSLTPESA